MSMRIFGLCLPKFHSVPFSSAYNGPSPNRSIALFLCAMSVLVLLAACGPEESETEGEQMVDEALSIARQYDQDGNIDRARAQLQTLDVANPTQWLVYLADRHVSESLDPADTDSLVHLVVGLGVQSRRLLDYAAAHDLVEITSSPTGVAAEPAKDSTSTPKAVVVAQAIAVSTESPVESDVGEAAGLPTPTSPPLLPDPTATLTTVPKPIIVASSSLNIRNGPGTVYSIVGALDAGAQAEIIAKNAPADWWQIVLAGGQEGWVYGPLVEAAGDVEGVAVAADIPEPPPTFTPAPVVEAAEAPTPEPQAQPQVAEGPDFRVVEKRLWDVYENGGRLSGPTVICGEKRQLVVNVIDANGSRVNGVAVQVEFGAKEIFVTGAQGKGDGLVEFVLGGGQDVRVIRDNDGRDVTSEVARGLTTQTPAIPYEYLIAGRYCTDDATCKQFADPGGQAPACWGHFSWTVTFQRKY